MYITPSATLQSTSEIPAQSEALLSLPKSDAIPQGQLRNRKSNHRRSRNSDSGLSAARTVPAESSSHAGNADELTTKPLHIVTRSALPPVVRRPMRSLTPGSTPQQPASSVKQQQNTGANQCMKPAVSSAKHEKGKGNHSGSLPISDGNKGDRTAATRNRTANAVSSSPAVVAGAVAGCTLPLPRQPSLPRRPRRPKISGGKLPAARQPAAASTKATQGQPEGGKAKGGNKRRKGSATDAPPAPGQSSNLCYP